jgi:hypothetical protein
VFWSDLASAPYTKDTLVRLEELKIEYVPKEENPLNVPQLRAIKKFCVNLKKKGLQQHLSSNRCKVLDGKDQKKSEVY